MGPKKRKKTRKKKVFTHVSMYGGPEKYYRLRAKEILGSVSGSMLEGNKEPLIYSALLSAYEEGRKS